jgi:putative ABC transport system permease protein
LTAVAIKGLLGRKLRAALTAVAIVLGVAMVSGTYILTDTIEGAFNTVFADVYKHTDAVVTGRSAIGNSNDRGGGNQPPSFPESLLARVRALPGVATASGSVSDLAGLVGRDGKVIARGGAPGLAFSYSPAGQRFNPLTLTSGNWPATSDEVAIDAATASKENYKIGDHIDVVGRGPAERFRIAGTVEIAGISSLGGSTMAMFTLPEAQRLFNKRGLLDQISVAATLGTSPRQLVREIRPLLPPSAQVRTGAAQAKKQSSDTSGFLNIFKDFLLAFGGIALFVGSFVIANTLGITIAQRTRELATLRSLGATRRQVRRSVLVEALVIGVIASVIGLFAGLGLAKALNALLTSLGIDLPHSGTVFKARTVIVSLLVGILVTVLAALRPAIRATRVPPIAAVREGALLPPSRWAKYGPFAAAATVIGAVALMLIGLFASGVSTGLRLLSIGVGAAGLFIGVAMLSAKLVPPLARVLGWPASKIGGAAGALARRNSIRDPSRTASTASALMIGLALVTMVGVLAAGLRSRFENDVNQLFIADYAITSTNNFTPIGVASANAVQHVPGVEVVSGVRAGQGKTSWGDQIAVSGVDPNITKVIALPWKHGNAGTPGQLGSDGAILSQGYASANKAHLGTRFTLEVPSGTRIPLVVRGIYAPPKGGAPLGDVTISQTLFDQAYQNPQNVFTFVNMTAGATAANTQRLQAALKSYPDAKLQTKDQFKHNQEQGLTTLLNLLYVLLSLSIVISLFGIVNTLVLTVFERTRELGMLRAVGMTRRQVRRMIRHESVITALLGATLGIPIGIVLAVMVGVAIGYSAVTIPVGTLIVFVIAAIIAGLIAAIFPARRAGRLNVLEALQYE